MTADTLPLRHVASVLVSNVDKKSNDGDEPVRLVNYTDVYYRNVIRSDQEFMSATATADQIRRFRVERGDSIITKDSETPTDIAVPTYVADADSDMVCGYHLALIRPSVRIDGKYLSWALWSEQVRQQFAVRANGMTRYGLTYDAIQSVRVPALDLEEQRRIADFLDDQVARIDAIVGRRQAQLADLDESILMFARSAVSGQPLGAAAMRSSGIPWVPEIPAVWGSPRICQVARMGTGHTPSRSVPEYWVSCDIPWLTTADVHRFRHDEIDEVVSTELQISELGLANSAAVLHPAGTVALSRTASAGFSIIMGVATATSQDFATWTCGSRLRNRYLLWCLRSMRQDLLERLAMGSTHKTIYFPDLMSIKIPLPSLGEQDAIVDSVESHVEATRAAMAAVRRSVELMREYKSSLITAAVTGELDVTTARPGVPA